MLRVISELRPAWVVGENVAGIVNMALDQVYADLENEGYTVQALIIPACAVDAPHRRDRCAIIGCRAMERKYNRGGWRAHSLEDSDCVRFGEPGILSQQQGRAEFERYGKNVPHPNKVRCDLRRPSGKGVYGDAPCYETDPGSEDMAYSDSNRLEKPGMQGLSEKQGVPVADSGRRAAQPGLGGVATRIPYRLDRGMSVPGYWMPEPGIPRITSKKEHRKDRLQCLGNAVVPQQFYPVFQAIADIERSFVHG